MNYFSGHAPKQLTSVIDAKCFSWRTKLKHIGCVFMRASCEIDVSGGNMDPKLRWTRATKINHKLIYEVYLTPSLG